MAKLIRWHHGLNGHEFKQTLGNSEELGNLEFCGPWGHKKSDTTELLNNNKVVKGIPTTTQ